MATPLPTAPANTIFVSQGETVYDVARRYDVPVRDLIEANRLTPPYRLTAGQRLVLPVPQTYTVKAGDTLYGISRQFNVDLGEIVRLNGIAAPYMIRTGQSLRLPGTGTGAAVVPQREARMEPQRPAASRPPAVERQVLAPQAAPPPVEAPAQAGLRPPSRVVPAVGLSPDEPSRTPPPVQGGANVGPSRAPAGVAVEALPPMGPAPSASEPVKPPPQAPAPTVPPAPQPAPQTLMPPAETQVAAAPPQPPAVEQRPPARAGGRFLWPITGPILSDYGPKEGGLHNDGINIGAPRGTPVVAADNGVVAYSGNELRGFGNLLLVRHADGWVTAYAHLDTVVVSQGQTVKRGERLGTVGQTGNVRTPQLHFEIRRGSRALDPRDHLEGLKPAADRR